MTESELAAVVRGIVPAVRAYLTQEIGGVTTRLVVAETRLAVLPTHEQLGELRDRVVTVETKALQGARPPEVSLAEFGALLERLAAAEARLAVLGDVRDRIVTIEAKTALPVVPSVADVALVDLRARLDAVEAVTKDVATVRERVAVMEVRSAVPGPPGVSGADGKDGTNGTNGSDGRDGLGFDDLAVDFDGDRTLAVRFTRGVEVKTFPVVLPFLRYEGVYLEGKAYDVGDVTTWAGSTWHCTAATTAKPGEGSPDWKLMVKRGRDGRDGKDAEVVPVVSVGRR